MRINNVSTETSVQLVVIMSIITSVMTIALVIAYTTTSVSGISILGFFQWLLNMFQSLRAEMSDEPFLPWILLVLFFGAYIGFFASVISRANAIVRFNSGLNVKYINMLEGRIEFFFTQPQYNITCAYSDIEKLYMDLQSTLVHTKNGSYVAFQQMNLTFKVLNGKEFKLSNVTSSPMKLIYKVIDWTRGVQSFDYGFSGYGEIPDYREKIDTYIQSGYKDIVGKEGATKLKWMSIIFFIIGAVFLFAMKDMFVGVYKDPALGFIFMPFSIFFIISFIIDIILVVDAIRDNKYRGYNG
jgi:hypothetical protein